MAGLPVQNVSVRVVCGTEELNVSGSSYLSESTKRLFSKDDLDTTLETYINKYKGTSVQFSLTEGDPSRGDTKWVVTPRGASLGKLTDVKGSSKPTDTSYLDAIIREFEEETGTTIPSKYFHTLTPTTFCLNIDPAGKAILDKNYNDLKPATETWEWKWVLSTAPCPGTLVPASDIQPSNLTKRVLAIKAKLSSKPSPAAMLSKSEVEKSMVRSDEAYTGPEYPAPNLNETLADYVKRVSQGRPAKEMIAIRKFGVSRGLKGGRTIRRKKLRQPKKRGTSKRGARR